jgi:hypothetical protein
MAGMANFNQLIRRSSSMVDTSGRYPPVLTALPMGSPAGVYVEQAGDQVNDILQGRISLSIIGVLIVAAAAFYYYTRSIQGGG